MKKPIIGIVFLAMSFSSFAFGPGDSLANKYAATITAKDLTKHLTIIASDEFEGRETGKPGQKKAAEYIKAQFINSGLEPGNKGNYFQEYPLITQDPKGVEITVNGKKYEFLKDFYYFPGFGDTLMNINEITFLGYGISDKKYDDYTGFDAKGKALVVLSGEPKAKNKKSFITGNKKVSDWSINHRMKGRIAAEKGVSAMFVVVDDLKANLKTVKFFIENPTMRLDNNQSASSSRIPVFYINKEMAGSLLQSSETEDKILKYEQEISKKGKPKRVSFESKTTLSILRESEKLTSENVLGFVEGTDLKDEILVVTSHYDHLGTDGEKIYNGADDDGSGTVSVMEIAEAFAKAKAEGNGPRRSILFMTVSGEEKGLFGSQYYVENPVYPLENTIANLNIDMVGRVDKKYKDNPNYLYLIGSDKLSTELHKISENANSGYTNLTLDYTYNRPNDPNRFYYRSDHYNFAKNNIPVIFYFNGSHEDYHKATDTVDKINFSVLEKRAKLVFYTAWELANRDERLQVDVESDFK
ncbi:MAG: M28 family peptidase [Bacteroidota bacterium]|nr:M28 family peptidase [Bacteroidota bacterium]